MVMLLLQVVISIEECLRRAREGLLLEEKSLCCCEKGVGRAKGYTGSEGTV